MSDSQRQLSTSIRASRLVSLAGIVLHCMENGGGNGDLEGQGATPEAPLGPEGKTEK